jgi:hypothetical protein
MPRFASAQSLRSYRLSGSRCVPSTPCLSPPHYKVHVSGWRHDRAARRAESRWLRTAMSKSALQAVVMSPKNTSPARSVVGRHEALTVVTFVAVTRIRKPHRSTGFRRIREMLNVFTRTIPGYFPKRVDMPWAQGVADSIPVAPTNGLKRLTVARERPFSCTVVKLSLMLARSR